jgi:hypothetical protein
VDRLAWRRAIACSSSGLSAPPPEDLPQLRDGYALEEVRELNLKTVNLTSLIWATGYALQQRGVTSQPGLYFVGLPWLDTQKSGLLLGVGSHAEYIAGQIIANR